ncbi:hypothetical protein RSJ21_06930 [Clostridium botulinum]|uniref:Uncharacterized protein n=3 Tax=Clostridium TaxID=1485 RepID=A5I155_CLOBH|nr:hypothetical protein CLK_0662 [Clostridium botulinum A3 str. Loch Maree]AUM87355.1 hypothetical protein RSJ15_06475 [Clostridium botulinum]PIH05829.1 hypothetical protein CS538_00465 [Clostridium combesii]CAL82766.1 hypothetical protein CBO1218 [Clostridium botulinum A str. ATCC 3502]AUN10164.1 hypothetical protein RSJ6_06485 [Clostridium botulinum]
MYTVSFLLEYNKMYLVNIFVINLNLIYFLNFYVNIKVGD